MDEDVIVTSSDGANIALEQCRSLVCDQPRSGKSKREFSTHLYCSDDWEPIEQARIGGAPIDPLNGVTVIRFDLGDDIARAISDEIFGGETSVQPIAREVSDNLAQRIGVAVSDRIDADITLNMRRRIKPIASLPAKSLVTGGTTDGLHLDAIQPRTVFRVGINLGSATRFVMCGLTSLRLLRDALGTDLPDASVTHAAQYDYSRLVDHDIRVVRFEVPAGYGWMMQTERVLHDGRRAHPHLPSRFVLMEAEIEK
jgi:hypothetical protein